MLSIDSKSDWNYFIEYYFPDQDDVYFRYEYHKLWAKQYRLIPEAYLWKNGDDVVFWPHLVNNYYAKAFNSEVLDLTTPYGYGGPLYNNDLCGFLKEYNRCYPNKTELIRFHPLVDNHRDFDSKHIDDIAIVDLSKPIAIKKGHRYNIRKSKERGCIAEVLEKPTNKQIDKFTELYHMTMDRNKAHKRYYFNKYFIRNHFKMLDAFLIQVKLEDEVIASSIYLKGKHFLHYHLSGSDRKYSKYYPTDLMISTAIEYGKDNKYKMFMLGGGRGSNDSLFKFKMGFANATKRFYIGKR